MSLFRNPCQNTCRRNYSALSFLYFVIIYMLVEEGALFRLNGLETKVLSVKNKYMYHLCKKQIELHKDIFFELR